MEKKRHSVRSDILFWVKYFRENKPMVLWANLAVILLTPLDKMLALYFPKVTLGMVERQAGLAEMAAVLTGYCLLYLAAGGICRGIQDYSYMETNEERLTVIVRLFLKSLRIRYADAESEEGKTAYRRAVGTQNRGDASASTKMLFTTREFIITVLNFVLYSTVLGTLSLWMAVVLLLLAGVSYFLKQRDIRFYESIRPLDAANEKHYYYVKSAMGDASAAKDIRIFGMGKWLRDRLDIVLEDEEKLRRRQAAWNWKQGVLNRLVGLVRDIGAYAYLIYLAAEGRMPASDFVLYFAAVTGFSEFVQGLAGYAGVLRHYANETDWVRGYLEAPEETSAGERHVSELSRPVSIEFRDVSFSYQSEGERHRVFSHLNLKIEAGEKLALVGANGAGKTTLVKLLCGFYEPEEGVILLNGIDMREFVRAELYELFSVVFQDVFLPPFLVDESIVLKKTEQIDRGRLLDALEKAGLWDLFRERGIAMDRYMGRQSRRDGVELSGGQRQRLLLARAIYRDGAVMVLDEPTASLDPIAESQVYGAYQEFCQGRTSVFISHRLASTSFSDRIVLLDQGEILETGSHEELMAKNGAYAELFRIQSSYYRDQGGFGAENRAEADRDGSGAGSCREADIGGSGAGSCREADIGGSGTGSCRKADTGGSGAGSSVGKDTGGSGAGSSVGKDAGGSVAGSFRKAGAGKGGMRS